MEQRSAVPEACIEPAAVGQIARQLIQCGCDGLCPITQDKIGRVLNMLRTN
jgi:hypothetical protein